MTVRSILALLLCLLLPVAGFSAEKKKAKKKKDYDYENSKYKSYKVLVDDDERTYRFDERGNPIQPDSKKKKKASKKKKKADEEAASCEAGEACQDADVDGKTSEAPKED